MENKSSSGDYPLDIILSGVDDNEQHNEGIRSAVLGAGLAASLFANSPNINAQDIVKPALTNPVSKDGITAAVEQVEGLSNVRKLELDPRDEQLNNILSEIQSKLESGNQEEYKELFNKLSTHIEYKYGYKIEPKNLDELSSAGISEQTKGMSIFEILGWLGLSGAAISFVTLIVTVVQISIAGSGYPTSLFGLQLGTLGAICMVLVMVLGVGGSMAMEYGKES